MSPPASPRIADPTLEAATEEADEIIAAQAAEAAAAVVERKATAAAAAAGGRDASGGIDLQRRLGGAVVVSFARRGRTIM